MLSFAQDQVAYQKDFREQQAPDKSCCHEGETVKWLPRELSSPVCSVGTTFKGALKWLDIFSRAKKGDEHLQAVLQRYSRLVVAKRENEEFKDILRREAVSSPPILTSLYHISYPGTDRPGCAG